MAQDGRNPFDIPQQMRTMAETSIDQARRTFESFMDAAQGALSQMERQASSFSTNARDANSRAVEFAEANVRSAFELAQRMVSARTPAEMMEHQRAYIAEQMARLQEQSRMLNEMAKSAGDEAGQQR